MFVKLELKTSGEILEIYDVLTIKKALIKACYNEFDALIITTDKNNIIYPIKNISKIEIYKIWRSINDKYYL